MGASMFPQVWPQLSPDEIAAFAGKPYADVAYDIISRFIG